MENEFEQFTGFQWDKGNIDKNLHKHDVENWECEQIFFNELLIILEDQKHTLTWIPIQITDLMIGLVKSFVYATSPSKMLSDL